MALSGVLLLPVAAFVWTLWRKLGDPVAPDAFALTGTGLGALAINLSSCAFTLARFLDAQRQPDQGSVPFRLRNDAIANIGIIAAGIVTAFTRSLWPDVIVGMGIAAMNADAARAVWRAARDEHREASVRP